MVVSAEAVVGHFVRTIGLLRAHVKIGMMNLVYNMILKTSVERFQFRATSSCMGAFPHPNPSPRGRGT
jgi:hypothetical protein